jgi:hypothetical protein
VTVVIPAYNRAGNIERAVLSALRQRPAAPAEVLVVDDCSTDQTAAVARRAGAHVVRHDVNQGAGAARNTAIAHSSQPWLAFLDSDDEWLANHLDSLWTHRDRHVFLSGAALRCEPGGRNRYLGPTKQGGMVVRSPAEIATLQLITASGVLVRRDIAQAAGGFRPLHGVEDIDLWLRVLERGTGYVSPEVSVLYHVHPGQVSDDDMGLLAGRRDVLSAYADRSWFTPRLVRDWDTSMAWDAARMAQRDGDVALAARHLSRLVVEPARIRVLFGVLVFRWRARRRSFRVGSSGAPTLAVLGERPTAMPATRPDVPTYELVSPHGATRIARYLDLARRPAAALLVDGLADRAVAKVLGMGAIRCPRACHDQQRDDGRP